MQIVSKEDNLHEMSKLFFLGKIRKKYFKRRSAEIFTQDAKRQSQGLDRVVKLTLCMLGKQQTTFWNKMFILLENRTN